MNDHQLLELAAKAAEVEHVTHEDGDYRLEDGLMLVGERGEYLHRWNPLTDSADALELAVALCMPVDITDEETVIDGLGIRVSHNDDALGATRRAIVLAAAEMERRSENQVGDRLPPIGTICQQQTWVNREWRTVTVVAHFNNFAVCAWEESPGDSQVELVPPGDLRSLCSDEICEHSYANKIGCPECGEVFKR